MLVPLILMAYLFMLAISIFIGSITLLVKQTTTIVRIVLYLVRILAGYFFTIRFFGSYNPVLSKIVICLPITTGQYAIMFPMRLSEIMLYPRMGLKKLN